ncbi:MAG: spore cortex biosynthesis protein YabQ [Clostridia bacterium]|nr:spore cortex biosynthesis protein YabQ [Clostridia bacterium]
MYSVPQNEQLSILVSSLGLGFLLGILYDVLRALRLSVTNSKIALVVSDIIYFILFGLITFIFILALNKGEIRFYIIIGELIGAVFYYISLGIAVIKITDKMIALLKRFYSFIFKVISAPFRLIKKCFSKLLCRLRKFFLKTEKKSSKIRKKLLPKLRLYVYNLFGILLAGKINLKKGGRNIGENYEEEKASKTG